MSWKGELLRYMDPEQTARYGVPDMPTNRIDDGQFHTVQNDDTQPLAAQRQAALNAESRANARERKEAQREQARAAERVDRARREVAAQGAEPEQFNRFVPPRVANIAARITALPTPGGLAPLIAALLFFIFAIVPMGAQGSTRLELIWRVLTGGAALPIEPGSRRAAIAEAQANAQSAEDIAAAAAAGGIIDASGADPGAILGGAAGGIISQWWGG